MSSIATRFHGMPQVPKGPKEGNGTRWMLKHVRSNVYQPVPARNPICRRLQQCIHTTWPGSRPREGSKKKKEEGRPSDLCAVSDRHAKDALGTMTTEGTKSRTHRVLFVSAVSLDELGTLSRVRSRAGVVVSILVVMVSSPPSLLAEPQSWGVFPFSVFFSHFRFVEKEDGKTCPTVGILAHLPFCLL